MTNRLFNDVETLRWLARFVPYLFIFLGCLVGMAGLYVRGKIEDRVKFLTQIFAYVSPDGAIIESKNFRWKIGKMADPDAQACYLINDLYRDASEVKVKPDSDVGVTVSNAMAGKGVRFNCANEKIPNFKVIVGE